MTRTQVLASMEAAQLRRYHAAYPQMTALLSQMSDDDCKKALKKQTANDATSIRTQVFRRMMEPYLPPSFRVTQEGNISYTEVKPIRSMSRAAARGMVEASKAGHLDANDIWLTIYRDYPSIVATAKAEAG